jgi:hypothetical protein
MMPARGRVRESAQKSAWTVFFASEGANVVEKPTS